MIFDLVQDFAAALATMPSEHCRQRVLALLDEAIRRDVHFIERHPTTFFQCMWNTCWWYDCPEAAGHYVEGKTPGQEAALGLHKLLDRWRQEKERRVPGFAWLRCLRPPEPQLRTALKMILRGHENVVSSVSFSPDGRRLASAGWDGTVRLWDAHSGAELFKLSHGPKNDVLCVCHSPDGRLLATGSQDGTVRVWDAQSGGQLLRLQGHENPVDSVSFSPNGRLASGARDETVRIWDVSNGTQLLCMRAHEGMVACVCYSPDGRRLASCGGKDWVVRVWDAENGTPLLGLHGHEGHMESVCYSPDGRLLATGSQDGTVRIWDAGSGAQLRSLQGTPVEGYHVAFSPDGRRLASTWHERKACVWDVESVTPLYLWGHHEYATSVSWSPDGRAIATGSGDRTVRIWSVNAGIEPLRLHDHPRKVTSVKWSSDGHQAASAGWDGTVRLWDARSGLPLFCLQGHQHWVTALGWSPDSRLLASGGHDGTVCVWDTASGVQVFCLEGHDGMVWSFSWSPDGADLTFTTRTDCEITVRVWNRIRGDCEIIKGSGIYLDPPDTAASSHWRTISTGIETMVETASRAQTVAWFPIALEHLTAHPSGRTWAGFANNHFCPFTLEGCASGDAAFQAGTVARMVSSSPSSAVNDVHPFNLATSFVGGCTGIFQRTVSRFGLTALRCLRAACRFTRKARR